MDEIFQEVARGFVTDYMKKYDRDVPQHLRKLFAISSKKSLKAHASKITITQEEFVTLIQNCNKIGYQHQIQSNDFIRDDLHPSEEQYQEFHKSAKDGKINKKGRKVMTKVTTIFEQRRFLVAHAFWNETRWHLFYFDQKDTENRRQNHWIHGPHYHFVNDLWPNHTIEEFWKALETSKGDAGSSLHIRYQPPKT